MTTLLYLSPVVVLAVLVWNYRRQAAAREAASAERMKALLDRTTGGAPVNPAVVQLQTPATAAPAPLQSAVKPKPQVVSGFALRAQLMPADDMQIFHLLQSTLPQHEVFPRVSLTAFIQLAENLTGFAREAQERRLADAAVDFLICDKTLKPVAAVHCETGNGSAGRVDKAADMAAFTAACVASVGMRWVEISPGAPPAPDAIRALVLGA